MTEVTNHTLVISLVISLILVYLRRIVWPQDHVGETQNKSGHAVTMTAWIVIHDASVIPHQQT
jgi:hypothetical protein